MLLREAGALFCAALIGGLGTHPTFAQSFPSKPLQLVIPSAPGAAYDLIGRTLADGARAGLGSIVVDNKPGGNFTIGAAYVKRAPPDGHTVLLGGNVFVIGEAINLTRTYNFFQDFEPVGHVTDLPFYLTVHRESVPVATGKFKLLATVGGRRSTFQPDIPTFAEAGVAGVELVSWFGTVAPAGTPKPIINRLNAEFNRALQKPEVRERFAQQGLEIGGGSPEDMAARMRSDYERYLRIVKATGMKAD